MKTKSNFLTALVGLVAATVYALTLATYVFPGESARLMSEWGGFDAITTPEHAVWGACARAFAALGFGGVATRMNLLSLVCGVLGAMFVFRLVAGFVRRSATQEEAVRHVGAASLVAGLVAAAGFVFSTAVWQAATHLEYRIFDVTLLLAAFGCVAFLAEHPAHPAWLALATGALYGVGLVESPQFVAFAPVFLTLLIATLVRNDRGTSWPMTVFAFATLTAALVALNLFTAPWLAADPEAAKEGATGAFLTLVTAGVREMRAFTGRSGWLVAATLAILPFLACGFAARRGLNNDRRWSQYAFHGAMTVCTILAYATPLAPEALFRRWGVPPVALSTLVAVTAGYLAAYWFLLAKCPLPSNDSKEASLAAARFGRGIAAPVLGLFAAVVALAALLNAFDCTRGRGAFADACAEVIVKELGDRAWFVTDGTLDEHLRIAAATRGKDLTLVCLQRDMDDTYLKSLAARVKEKGLKAGAADLPVTLQLGVLPFLQDWFAGDPDVHGKVAIFGVPDFWHMGEKTPIPEKLFFTGAKNAKAVDAKRLLADFLAFWKEFDAVLPPLDRKSGSRAIATCDDPVDILRLQLRRHVGFIANNLGVLLQDVGMDKEAFAMYERVLKKIDPDNVCALFNEFEMARAGVPDAVQHKQEIEKQLRAIVDDPKRRYILWSLSRYYGYIRSPEIFARMGYAWARSGQTGNAIAQVQRAIDFVPTDKRAALMNMMAAIYADGNQIRKSRETYENVLAADKKNHDALLGLTRLAMREGDTETARAYLKQAASGDGIETALLKLMDNDLVAARLAMQRVTDAHPKSLQAWALLAGVILQQADSEKSEAAKKKALEELEQTILPKMETVAESPRDYFLQITRGLVLLRKGPTTRKDARNALILAMMARPDATAVSEMVLNLDIEMDDAESAEKHARTVLRRNRHDKLANYALGSIRLKDGDYAAAETFLMISCSQDKPLAAAQNDLAEVLRRQQRYADAERYARAAIKTAPELYVAWETLGSTLLGAGKSLDEAEGCVKKAIELAKKNLKSNDIRMEITLARVQLARGMPGAAKSTLNALKKRLSELSNYDRDQYESLVRATKAK